MVLKTLKASREKYGIVLRAEAETQNTRISGRKPKTAYERFCDKYADLENSIDDFTPMDLTYYFKEVAKETGHRYAISLHKDVALFKRLLNEYSAREICGMIEFLYKSGQDYLETDRLSPNLLVSRWVNTIFADTQLWIDDKYVPKGSAKTVIKRQSNKGEYSVRDNRTVVGGKL